MALATYPLLNSSISTCTFATDGTGDITVGAVHGLAANDPVRFTTTGALPSEINVNGVYYVLAAGLTTTKLRIAATAGGTLITFAGAGSGTHTIWKSTKQGEFEARGVDPYAYRVGVAPNLEIDSAAFLNTLVGGCDFSGTVVTASAVHGLSVGNQVRFVERPPQPLSENQTYYVVGVVSTTKFQISLTQGGAPIAFDPVSDVWLANESRPLIGAHDVLMYSAKALLYKGASFAVLYVDEPFGYWPSFQAVFGFTQILLRTATESLSISVDAIGPIFVTASESLSISVDAAGPIQVSASDALMTADDATRGQNLFRYPFGIPDPVTGHGENLYIQDAPVPAIPKFRMVAESLNLVDEPTTDVGPALGSTESLSLSDAATQQSALTRNPTETLLVAIVAARVVQIARSTIDSTLTIADVARRLGVYARAVSELLSLSDAASTFGVSAASAVESLVIAHANQLGIGRIFSATESLNLAQSVMRSAILQRAGADTLVIADAPFKGILHPAFATEALVIAELATTSGSFHRNASELLALIDFVSRQHARTASEHLFIAEFASWFFGYGDPWEYYLDLRTGNLPLESTLDTARAESIASAPEAESSASAPEAESELAGASAESGLRYVDP